jgi:hypothetical protein
MPARLSTERPVYTSQELLRSALQRSKLRNAHVARRRLWLRWTLWGVGRAARYLGLPALLIGGLALGFGHWPPSLFANAQLPQPHRNAQPAATQPAASAIAAQRAREELAPQSMQLRIDADAPLRRLAPQAQSPQPLGQDKDPAPPTQQETP